MERPKVGLTRCCEYLRGFGDGAGHRGIEERPDYAKYKDDYLKGYLEGKESARQALLAFSNSIDYQMNVITVAKRGDSERPEDS
jgi:hypothetical protein